MNFILFSFLRFSSSLLTIYFVPWDLLDLGFQSFEELLPSGVPTTSFEELLPSGAPTTYFSLFEELLPSGISTSYFDLSRNSCPRVFQPLILVFSRNSYPRVFQPHSVHNLLLFFFLEDRFLFFLICSLYSFVEIKSSTPPAPSWWEFQASS